MNVKNLSSNTRKPFHCTLDRSLHSSTRLNRIQKRIHLHKKRKEKWEGRKILFFRIFWLIILKITGMGGFKGFRIIRLKILKSFFKKILL
jgi:hypothetical protein